MSEEAIYKLNLHVLKKLDPEIIDILYRSKYSALHELDRAAKIWHACEKAGPLFIVRRRSEPFYNIFLLNQKNNIDYVEEIFETIKYETKFDENFLFFETKKKVVNGLWVSEKEELVKLEETFRNLFKK